MGVGERITLYIILENMHVFTFMWTPRVNYMESEHDTIHDDTRHAARGISIPPPTHLPTSSDQYTGRESLAAYSI